MNDADLYGLVRGWCGDTMEIHLRLDRPGPKQSPNSPESPTVAKATFVTDGCGATVACGSMLTQMVKGLTLKRADLILPRDLVNALGGLPDDSMHCAGLAISALQNALFNWWAEHGDRPKW